MKPKRATKPLKQDRLLEPAIVSNIKAQRVQSAAWDFDRAVTEAEAVWGVDRLPYLVSDQTRQKWWRAINAFNEAIQRNDPDETRRIADSLIRGIDKLIDEAKAAGYDAIKGESLETPLPGGRVLCIVSSWPEYAAPPDPRGDLVVTWSLEEVARMVEASSMVNKVKTQWPGSRITQAVAVGAAESLTEELNDDIPF